jgi:AraC family transcriptional regulator, L-rhamnose operon transcriptional activator RhaR
MSAEHVSWTTFGVPAELAIDVNRHRDHEDTPPHDHDFVEIALVLAGTATHETLYGRRRVAAGDSFLIRRGAWHAYSDCEGLAVVNCCFRPRLLERELLWLAETPRLRLLLWSGGGDGVAHVRLPRHALTLCDETLEEIANPPAEEGHPLQVAGLLTLLHCLARELDTAQVAGANSGAAADVAVAGAVRLMSADLARPWTVAELAEAVAVSPAHFSRLFSRAVGRPPIAHLSALRAEAAAAQLLRSPEPICAIGRAVGWEDPGYFARRFRAHFGAAPSEFRRRRSGRG